MKARLIVSVILVAVAGVLLPQLCCYQAQPFMEHYARAQLGATDWIILIGGSILWSSLTLLSFIFLIQAIKENPVAAWIYVAVDVVVIVLNLILIPTILITSPVSIVVGYSLTLITALYLAGKRKQQHS